MGILTFSQNIADAEAPPPLPAGEYEATCTAAVDAVAQSSGNPLLKLTLQIARNHWPVDFDPGDGIEAVTLTVNNLVVRDIPSDRWRLKKACQAFGVAMSKEIDPNDFVMKTCRVKTRISPDLEGNPRAEIAQLLPL